MEIASEIVKWSHNFESLIKLMEEENTFNFSNENLPIRLMFSRFIKFKKDQLNNPEFFCWAGVHMTHNKYISNAKTLFNEHEALYIDGIDADIYPRMLPNKEEKYIKDTMNLFYSWVSLYDLTRQWVIEDGDFKYNYLWLTSKFSQQETKEWAKSIFEKQFSCNPDDFKCSSI
jgi:hypothetical protein